ncbi:hypothetical protein OOT33_13500 [Sphingobium sp. DEHP117]|uniref:hypothetical protein n=1 Tax=Sphingobium sp. DEHP117 TaxID=2993436 RepID=UPI0027D5E14D|nr:hypothetical protein [Sphingobium sp. DEHP117]MDQ4421437.1 hypothetical protein [Sphingobium sp. DEHP117]
MNTVTPNAIMRQSRQEPASQATSIEMSRAVAEVQAAVTVAQARPRDESYALKRAVESCRTWEVAEGAFFRFPRGGETVSGESIHLAVELARCWGNIDYGIMELDRDDTNAVSEMLAFAWDLETNTKSRMTFLVPHRRDTRSGPKMLTDMRDIYENNANNGARRLRECIFRVLPPYLKEQAKQACRETLEKGQGEKSLQVRIAEAISAFEKIGINADRIEAKLGKSAKWTAVDVANLQVSYRSINRQEVSADDEFPRIGTEETVQKARKIADKAKGHPEPETGRSDEQHGDQHDGTDGSPEERAVSELLYLIYDARAQEELDACMSKVAALRGSLPSDKITELDAALDAAEARILRSQGE